MRRSVTAYSVRRSRKPSRAAFPDSLRPYGIRSAVRTYSGLHSSMTSSSGGNYNSLKRCTELVRASQWARKLPKRRHAHSRVAHKSDPWVCKVARIVLGPDDLKLQAVDELGPPRLGQSDAGNDLAKCA